MRIALFGGTFDPIHNAHLIIAREAAARYRLDRVLLVPSANPPHKAAGTTAEYRDRLRMVELACKGERHLEASRLEEGTARSYSIDTIERLRAQMAPDDELFFLIGADAFAEIQSWHRAADVLREVEFIVAARPGHQYPVPNGARAHSLDIALPVSSSEIRFRLETGEWPEELPPRVLAYIRENRLYGADS